jgi:hypothetical protein
MKNTNTHTSRESWLRAGAEELRPDFEKLKLSLPEKMRFSIAFTSTGKRGHVAGECWHPEFSGDQHYEVIIRIDKDDPVEILGILVHELIHSLLLPTDKHGKKFKLIARRIGLEGGMRHTRPTPLLIQRLQAIAANLGPLPHAKLNYSRASDVPKKQQTRHLKAECGATGCGYLIQLSAKWAKAALPVCPMNPKHGKLVCALPDGTGEEEDSPQTATEPNLS